MPGLYDPPLPGVGVTGDLAGLSLARVSCQQSGGERTREDSIVNVADARRQGEDEEGSFEYNAESNEDISSGQHHRGSDDEVVPPPPPPARCFLYSSHA